MIKTPSSPSFVVGTSERSDHRLCGIQPRIIAEPHQITYCSRAVSAKHTRDNHPPCGTALFSWFTNAKAPSLMIAQRKALCCSACTGLIGINVSSSCGTFTAAIYRRLLAFDASKGFRSEVYRSTNQFEGYWSGFQIRLHHETGVAGMALQPCWTLLHNHKCLQV